ncbi:MAG: MarR family transcriptional regulator [Ruminococcaceae bacterium]|nr:MarR family transcriptional regulator [Oscillospiraceae bacterium]
MRKRKEETEKNKNLLEKENATPSMFINDISKMFGLAVRHDAGRGGLSQGNRKILMCLARNDGISQLNLVKETGLSAPTVSVSLAKMEADELVRREANLSDLRQVSVYLTEKGKEQNDFMTESFKQIDEVMLKGITKAEQEQLKESLKKMLRNLIEYEKRR